MPRIVFTSHVPHIQERIWNYTARVTAERFGYEVNILKPRDKPPSDAEYRDIFSGAEAIITTWGAPRLDETVLLGNTKLRFVGHAAGSAASIVSPYLFERGVKVSTANREMAGAVARWCFQMTMLGQRNLLEYAQLGVHSPLRWANRKPGTDIRESTIGVWGYGDISKQLLGYLRVLEPREILMTSRSMSEEDAKREGVRLVDLDTLMEYSDVIHLLQALTESTKGMVNAEKLALIRNGSLLINAGRAHLIDEEAWINSLLENRFMAITDVHHEEPVPQDSPLHGLPNLIMTPHCAGLESPLPYAKVMLEDFNRLENGEPLLYNIDGERARMMTVEMTRSGKR